MKTQYIEINADNDVLSISIGIETLFHAVRHPSYGQADIKITDQSAFLKGLILELQRESEDGTTPVHSLFDNAVNEMLENGEEGVEVEEGEEDDL